MEEIVISRYFQLPGGQKILENITWRPTTTDDPRGLNLTGQVGKWLPIFIENPGFQFTPAEYEMETRMQINDITGLPEEISVPKTLMAYAVIDPYNPSTPLKPGYVEITKEEFMS